MNIVLWINSEPNQIALANKINEKFPVSAVITESRKRKRKITVKLIFEKLIEKIFLGKINEAWFGMQAFYRNKYPEYIPVPRIDVENINCDEAYNFTRAAKPDLIIVSGTSLIKKKLLSLDPSIGIINLHTGLSPYIKGGPNCTNWCIATGQFHLIGNTVMWIDEGIDTGNLIATKLVDVTGTETLGELHVNVMEEAHDLYISVIEKLQRGKEACPSINQNTIAHGVTYYSRDWKLSSKISLLRNFRNFKSSVNSEHYKSKKDGVKTI